MTDSYEFENNAIDGEDEVGSLNHSTVQSNLCGLLKFKCDKKLAVMSELSLDISQYDLSEYRLGTQDEIKPDVCAYQNVPKIPDKEDDLIKVSQMPDLAIEVLSPRQAVSYLIRKINAYLELGVKSCWLVIPANKYIAVYSQPNQYKSFDLNSTEVIDEVIAIRLPIASVFTI
ncbi:Uma2 family endonuclease [Candidatus Parabeggiatoa sp. HSG14]|uniref:Uma2 family endonuclease n=1 Tax=Candidatus Parabeggiatoa sp. HSG14 TaxID=3055593 RepID=UPI0025A831F8|nr:Uma2 family endonuclease [Thiotrichales bacterium HSG14]